ncbi:MAG TPA: dTMP kinase [Candidatus Faecivicinus avistercoris]|nr:dTMP kinase [Candidatus Faecivicinus avistercoris]
MKFDIVLFDFDGTIAESGEGIVRCARWALEQMGKPVPDDGVLRRFVGPPLVASFQELCGLSEDEARRAVAIYRERYSQVGLFEARIYPGIAPLLRALRRSGAWVAVASAKPEAFLVRILEHFGLSDCFDAVAGTTMENQSADKRAQLLAAMPEGAEARRACMVGDRKFDVAAGRALGMHAVGVGYGYGSREELEAAGADFFAEDVAALCAHLLEPDERPRGRMITFEGTDGCGKSTQMEMLAGWLGERGYEVTATREPGGCPIAERIREVILSLDSSGMSAECEALLYAAARIEHVRSVVLPALRLGKIVLCDRFLDSSMAYQAAGRELGEDFIRQINRAASEAVTPDCTLLFDIDRDCARARMAQGAPLDRLESEREDFFDRVARAYDRIAREAPQRVRRIDAARGVQEVFADVLAAVKDNLD